MGYIADFQLVVIFGGEAANGTILGDTWVYTFNNNNNSNTWFKVSLILYRYVVRIRPLQVKP